MWVLRCKLGVEGRNLFARATPLCMKVDYDGCRRCARFGGAKSGIPFGDGLDFGGRGHIDGNGSQPEKLGVVRVYSRDEGHVEGWSASGVSQNRCTSKMTEPVPHPD